MAATLGKVISQSQWLQDFLNFVLWNNFISHVMTGFGAKEPTPWHTERFQCLWAERIGSKACSDRAQWQEAEAL